jgi:hypothetical protein
MAKTPAFEQHRKLTLKCARRLSVDVGGETVLSRELARLLRVLTHLDAHAHAPDWTTLFEVDARLEAIEDSFSRLRDISDGTRRF